MSAAKEFSVCFWKELILYRAAHSGATCKSSWHVWSAGTHWRQSWPPSVWSSGSWIWGWPQMILATPRVKNINREKGCKDLKVRRFKMCLCNITNKFQKFVLCVYTKYTRGQKWTSAYFCLFPFGMHALYLRQPRFWSFTFHLCSKRNLTFESVLCNLQLCFLCLQGIQNFYKPLFSLSLMLLSYTAPDTWTLNHCLLDSAHAMPKYKNATFPIFWGYLDFAIIGKVSQSNHSFRDCSSQGLLDRLLLPLGDPGEAWQQVDQVWSEQWMTWWGSQDSHYKVTNEF